MGGVGCHIFGLLFRFRAFFEYLAVGDEVFSITAGLVGCSCGCMLGLPFPLKKK
jgi:hypothetical protein